MELSFIANILNANKSLFSHINKEIWLNPENGFEEFRAHDLLCRTLKENGFNVEPSYKLSTGFRACFSSNNSDSPNVCFVCEYDAVPGVGHGSGHNLVAMTNFAAALAVKQYLEQHQISGKVCQSTL